VILIAATFTTSMAFLFTARYTEPGLLPTRPKHNPDHEGLSEAQLKRVKREHQVVLSNNAFELPELRAKFCAQTANCVEKFDHFCPWVGNSVGVRNYRYFVGFVTVTTVHSILVCAASIHHLSDTEGELSKKVEKHPAALLLAIYTIVITLMVGGLAVYHWGLVIGNSTTNEELKDVWARKRNPYDQGCYKNVCTVLCSPLRASYMREGAEDTLAGSVLAEAWASAEAEAQSSAKPPATVSDAAM